jgi:hypothetical protein
MEFPDYLPRGIINKFFMILPLICLAVVHEEGFTVEDRESAV